MNRHEFLMTMAGTLASALVPRWSRGESPAEPKTFTYKTAGGCEIKLDVYGSEATVRKPALIWIHGGALIMGSRKNPPDWLDPKGNQVVISIDYRLAPETKLPAIIEDVQDAFRWVHQQGPRLLNIDAGKLVVAGGSAGGYLTLMTGFCVKPRPRALISVSGYGGIVGPWYSRPSPFYLTQPHIAKDVAYASVGTDCVSEPPDDAQRGRFYLYCRQNGIWPKEVTGHDPDAEPQWFDRYCPVRNVSAQYPPTVLIHGTADTDVPYEESDQMDKALTRFKVEHEFITVPGGGHVLRGVPENQKARIYDQALGFVKKHTS
ncbi:MAG TPA: alpha/beta hydrolase [Terriglobia bacterium]|nr:alpha/beta hydrolase [Terriglobia bacterium]